MHSRAVKVAATACASGIPEAVNPAISPVSITPIPPGTGAIPPMNDATQLIKTSCNRGRAPRHQRGDEQCPGHDRSKEVQDVPQRFEAARQARDEIEDGRLDRGDFSRPGGRDRDDHQGHDNPSDVARAPACMTLGNDPEHRRAPASTHHGGRDRLDVLPFGRLDFGRRPEVDGHEGPPTPATTQGTSTISADGTPALTAASAGGP